jgi:hypothetical protein
MNYVMSLPVGEFCELIVCAADKIQEEKIWQQWIAVLPFMYLKQLKFMPFRDFYDVLTGANIDRRPEKEIIQDILDAHGMKSLEDFKDGNI